MSNRIASVAFRWSVLWAAALWLNGARAGADDAATPAPPVQPVLMAQVGHSKSVTSVAFSPNGAYVVTGAEDKTARLWETATGREVRRFEGHASSVNSVAFSPDGKHVLTGSSDKTARLWDAATASLVRRFEGHADAVWSVGFSPDGAYVLTGSEDKTARLWEAANAKWVRSFAGHTDRVAAVAFSPDGAHVLTGSYDRTARLWDKAGGREVLRYAGHASKVTSVAFLKGDRNGSYFLTGSEDKTARLWVTSTGAEYRRYDTADVVTSVDSSPDGSYLVTGSWDKSAQLWEAISRKPVRRLQGHAESVRAVAFSPDGRQILTGSQDKTARLWAAASAKEAITKFEGRTDGVTSVAFSPDGTRILTGSDDRTARLWDGLTGKATRRFQGHANEVNSVAFSPDGTHILTGGGYDVIGTGIALSGGDTSARLWDAATGEEVQQLKGHTWTLTSVAYSPDGTRVITGSMDKTVRLWEAATGKEIWNRPHAGFVYSVAFSPNGAHVLTGSGDGTARLWETATGNPAGNIEGHTKAVLCVAFSPDGSSVVTGSKDNTARSWDRATGKLVKPFYGHMGWVTSVAYSPDGSRVLTASGDQNGYGDDTVRFWDKTTGKEVGRLEGHPRSIRSVAYSKDGTRLLTGSADGTTRLWDVATGRELCSLVSFRDGSWAVTDSAGRFDASNGGDVDGLHWAVGMEVIALAQLKNRYYEPGLLAKILGFNKEPLRQASAFHDPELYPEVRVEQSDGRLRIRLQNQGGGIGPVQVLVNGKERTADARSPGTDPGARELTLELDLSDDPRLLPGRDNRIEVFAYNARGDLSSRGRDAAPLRTKGDPPAPSLWAIVVGVSNYQGKQLALKFAAKDAKDFASALSLAGDGLFGVERTHVTLLTDMRRQALADALSDVRQAKAGDILVIFLAGHGVTRDDVFYYLTADAEAADLGTPKQRATTAISSGELIEAIKLIPALKQVLILDTCASGSVVAALGGKRGVPSGQVRALDRVKDRTGMFVLAGCASDAVSYESPQYGQGLLTYSLLLGMHGETLREGEYVDVASLFSFASDKVPYLAGEIGGVQQPSVSSPHGGGSFDIGRLTPEKQREVRFEPVRPRFTRPKLVDDTEKADVLELEERTVALLRGESYVRGAAFFFVDLPSLPGAFQIAGSYTTKDGTTKVRFKLRRGRESVTEWLDIEGSVEVLPARIVAAAKKGLEDLKRKPPPDGR